jgi:glycosyltransferase involved in cell wall biosynthesis
VSAPAGAPAPGSAGDAPLRVGVLGGVPPSLGGGGLELQIARTCAALEALGHAVVRVEREDAPEPIDVLHAFGAEPSVWHLLSHWTRNPAPLVLTPVIVVSPGREERLLRISARVPGVLTTGRMKRDLVGRAQALVAGTAYERDLLVSAFGAEPARVHVIGNGAAPEAGDAPLPEGVPADGYALLLGTVSERKRQAETVAALAGVAPIVVAGGFAGDERARARWERGAREAGAVWLGHVADGAVVAALVRRARALVHLSQAEVQSLAVLEALAAGTPVVLSDIPSHRELAAAHPGFVRIVSGPADVPRAVRELERPGGAPPAIPSWAQVASRLAQLYRSLVTSNQKDPP